MKIIISPAKKMQIQNDFILPEGMPVFLEETRKLYQTLHGFSEGRLKALFRANDKITHENYLRYRSMKLEENLTPAVLAYVGLQYQYLSPQIFTREQWRYVCENLRILSGFYGILRAGDGIVPYRLEMQAKLSVGGASDLYDFWGGRIYQELVREDKDILNLASKEYSRAVEPYLEPEVNYISCVFGCLQDGTVKVKATEAKMARGEMVRWLAKQGITSLSDVAAFDRLGYRYDERRSGGKELVFIKEKAGKRDDDTFTEDMDQG